MLASVPSRAGDVAQWVKCWLHKSWTQWHESLFLEFLHLGMEAGTREPWMLTGRLACYMQIGGTKRLSQTKWKVAG